MAEKIKGITIEIGGSTVGLNKALSATRKEINATQKELNEVDKALKLDPTNIDLVRQKQELLKKQITQTEDKVDALKKAKDQADRDMANGTEVNEEEYRKLVREISRGESALKELGTQADTVDDALKKAANGEEFDALGKNIGNSGKAASSAAKGGFTVFKGVVADLVSNVIQKAVAGLKSLASKFGELGVKADDLNTLSKQTGISTEDLQKMEYAADVIDVSVDDITGSLKKMKKNMVSTSKDTIAAWDALGVKTTDANGNLRNSTTVFYEVLEALSKVSNETERDTLAMQLFGKSADSLAGIVDDGGQALREMGKEAEELGVIMSQDTLDDANRFNDTIDRLKSSSAGIFANIGGEIAGDLAPQLEELQVQISEWIESDEGQQFLSDTATLIGDVLNGLISVIQWMAENKGIVTAIIVAITAVIIAYTVAQIAANAAIFACPITWIVTAIVALIATIVLLIMNWDKVAAVVKKVFDKVVSVIGQALGFIKQKCKDAVNFVISVLNGILGAVEWIVNKIIDAVNWGIGKINSMLSGITDVLSFVGINVNWQIPSVPEISIPRIPLLAKGGTVFSGQAIVGEAGPELLTVNGGKTIVTPLSGNEKAQTAGMNVTVQIDQFNNYDTDTDINTLSDRVADKIAFKARRAVRC